MIPRFKPFLTTNELLAALRPPHEDDIAQFEAAFASELKQKYAVAFPYGRTALIFLLQALGLENQEVICPAYTCIVVPHAIVTSGNIPVFVDSQPEDGNMNLDLVPDFITPRTGAILATSIFGYPCNLDKLQQLQSNISKDILIIQDCAHSFGARWNGKMVNQAGVAAIYGLNISKLATSIFGGMVTTDDESLYQKLIQLRNTKLKPTSWVKSLERFVYLCFVYPTFWEPLYSLVNPLERSGLLGSFAKYYNENFIDMPHDYLETMTKLEARVGREQLKKYPTTLQSREKFARYYHSRFNEEAEIKLFPLVEGATYSHINACVSNRAQFMQRVLKKGVQLGYLLEYSNPLLKCYRDLFGTNPERFPVSQYFADHVINLPVAGVFNQRMAEKTIQVIQEVLHD